MAVGLSLSIHKLSHRRGCHIPFALVLAPLLGACQFVFPAANELPRAGDPLGAVESVLVGSVVQPDPGVRYAEVIFWIRSADAGHRFRVVNQPTREGLSAVGSSLEHISGRLFAIPVRPGDYEMVGFAMDSYRWFRTELSPPLRFFVGSGEVLYIGSLEMRPCYSAFTKPDGQVVPQTDVGAIPAVGDGSERDIPLLRQAYPALREREIAVRVLPDDQLIGQSARSRRSCDYFGDIPE